MCPPLRAIFLVGVCSLILAGQAAGAIPADDGSRGRRTLGLELRELFNAGKFDELEQRAADYRGKKETFADGWWKITEFYVQLCDAPKPKEEASWKTLFSQLDRWVAAKPASDTVLIVRGAALTRYAWSARGGGYADTVSAAGWNLFGERLAQARAVLESARDRGDRKRIMCPGWYSALQTVALGQQWPRAEYEKHYRAAVAAHPDYFNFHLKKAYFLLPRWYGKEGEWQNFARTVGAQYGMDVFARVCWANGQIETFAKMFTELGITWDEIDQGFIELRRKNPTSSWTLNYHCRLAVNAREQAAAAQLFQEIGEDVFEEAWSSRDYFDKSRRWALQEQAVSRKTTTRTPRKSVPSPNSPKDRASPVAEKGLPDLPNLVPAAPEKSEPAMSRPASELPPTEKAIPLLAPHSPVMIESEGFTPPPITIPK